jgi:hypothetical protein
MPEAGQTPVPTHLTALLQTVVQPVDAPGLRLVSVSDAGYYPSASYHNVWHKMPDPKRP